MKRFYIVKIANSNVMPTLRGFRWYPYFVAQEELVAFKASKMTPAVAFERTFSAKITIIIVI